MTMPVAKPDARELPRCEHGNEAELRSTYSGGFSIFTNSCRCEVIAPSESAARRAWAALVSGAERETPNLDLLLSEASLVSVASGRIAGKATLDKAKAELAALRAPPRADVTDERLREIVSECGFDGVVCLSDDYAMDVARAVRAECESQMRAECERVTMPIDSDSDLPHGSTNQSEPAT